MKCERVTFKTAVLVWKCLHDVAPRYLVDLCVPTAAIQPVVVSHVLRCLHGALMVPWTRTSTGQRSFAVYGPKPWNRLPPAQNCRYLHSSAGSRPTSSSASVLVVAVSRIYTAVRRHCDYCEFGADHKCPDSTQLNSTQTKTHLLTLQRERERDDSATDWPADEPFSTQWALNRRRVCTDYTVMRHAADPV